MEMEMKNGDTNLSRKENGDGELWTKGEWR